MLFSKLMEFVITRGKIKLSGTIVFSLPWSKFIHVPIYMHNRITNVGHVLIKLNKLKSHNVKQFRHFLSPLSLFVHGM